MVELVGGLVGGVGWNDGSILKSHIVHVYHTNYWCVGSTKKIYGERPSTTYFY